MGGWSYEGLVRALARTRGMGSNPDASSAARTRSVTFCWMSSCCAEGVVMDMATKRPVTVVLTGLRDGIRTGGFYEFTRRCGFRTIRFRLLRVFDSRAPNEAVSDYTAIRCSG